MASRRWRFAWVALALAVSTAVSQARSFRPAMIPNGSVWGCANCHVSPAGGGPRNPFGQAVEAIVGGPSSTPFWSATLAALDSDGDGFSNGTELGDPDGDFLNLGPTSLVKNPGNAASKPNLAPVLDPVADQTVEVGSLLSFTVAASDPDAGQVLTYTLGAGAPAGASIVSGTGVFAWTPTVDQAPSTNLIALVVTDNGSPRLSATNTVRVVVTTSGVPASMVLSPVIASGRLSCSVVTVAGATYHLEFNAALGTPGWTSVAQVAGDGATHALEDPNPASGVGFYRVRVD